MAWEVLAQVEPVFADFRSVTTASCKLTVNDFLVEPNVCAMLVTVTPFLAGFLKASLTLGDSLIPPPENHSFFRRKSGNVRKLT
jgi:hypothetical protein